MEDDIKEIKTDVKKIAEDIVTIKMTQFQHEMDLREHIRRTNLLEESQEMLFEELRPIKLHVGNVQGFFKVIGAITTVLGFVAAIFKLLGKI